jgi:hypothetical protein
MEKQKDILTPLYPFFKRKIKIMEVIGHLILNEEFSVPLDMASTDF